MIRMVSLREAKRRSNLKKIASFGLSASLAMTLLGCKSTPVKEANTTVIVGETRVDLKKLAAQMQKDPQARTAVTAVNSSFNVRDNSVKYCPADGKRFSSRLENCPEHKVKLLPVE